MRILTLVVLAGCLGGTKKAAVAPAGGDTVSQLDQQAAVQDEVSNAQISNEQRVNSLHTDVAVRHREAVSWSDIVVSPSIAQAPTAPPPAQPLASPEPKQPEKLVIEAWMDLETANVGATVDTIRAKVEASGGRVVSENVYGSGASASSAAMEVRVPPAQAAAMTAWLETLGRVTSKRVLASDVSKTLFDQELALKNLELTMERLQALAAKSGPVADLLTIEKEMTRVRGEIERIKGEHRWLLDRVELATLTLQLRRSGDDDEPFEYEPEARVYPGPQLAMLTLFDPGMRTRTRFGGGASVRLQRYATFDLAIFPSDGMDSRAVLATFGTALYSSYLRDGHRRYFNPYVGVRVGYGYLSGDGMPVIAGEVGIEWFKHRYLLVDSSVRALGYITDNAEAALSATLGASVPF